MGFIPAAMLPLISALSAAGSAISGTIMGVKSNNAQKKAQKSAEKLQQEALNKANQKTPDASAILAAAQKGAGNATLLTDPTAAPNMTLGRSSLLGG